MSGHKKKTPSARVIAAQLLRDRLDINETREQMTEVFASRVSPEKREAVVTAAAKLTLRLRRSLDTILKQFLGATPAAAAGSKSSATPLRLHSPASDTDVT